MENTTNPNIEMMKIILDEEKEQIIGFISKSSPEVIYDRIYMLCAFDIAYDLLMSEMFLTDEVAAKIAIRPDIMSIIMKVFYDDDKAQLTPDYMRAAIEHILELI